MSPLLVIQLNYFALYGSASCIIPYLTNYIEQYSDATKSEIGFSLLVSSVLGIFVSLFVCSFADRYKIHLQLFVASLAVGALSFGFLLAPILAGQGIDSVNSPVEYSIVQDEPQPENPSHQQLEPQLPPNESLAHTSTDNAHHVADTESCCNSIGEPVRTSLWYFSIMLVSITGNISMTVSMTLSDAFCTIAAMKLGQSYGSIRVFGSVGYMICSGLMSFINPVQPFLMPALILFVIMAVFNVLVVVLWPDKSLFDLSAPHQNQKDDDERSNKKGAKKFNVTKFKFNQKFCVNNQTLKGVQSDLELSTNGMSSFDAVIMTKANLTNQFDVKDDDVYRNVRRCSLAPLGNSYLVSQYELDEKSGKHFGHVTTIKPLDKSTNANIMIPTKQTSRICRRLSYDRDQLESVHEMSPNNLSSLKNHPDDGSMSLSLHLRVIKMILFRSPLFARFLFLYAIQGFILAMNWYYLVPYLEFLDAPKSRVLGPRMMMCFCLTETVFYYFSHHITQRFTHSASLTLILFMFGARYLIYLAFSVWKIYLPLDAILIPELILSVGKSWFDCVFNEAALNFALEARDCVPQLIEEGRIPNRPETIEKVGQGFKATMVSLSSGCFDGFGVGLGALIGGWILDNYTFGMLWFVTSSLAVVVGMANCLFDIRDLVGRNSINKSQLSMNADK